MLIKYYIAQFIAIGLDEANLIINDEVVEPKTKGQKRIYSLFFKLQESINKIFLPYYAKKFINTLEGLKQSKLLNEWSSLIVGLELAYLNADKIDVHKNTISKTLSILKQEDEFKYSDKFLSNSLELAKIINKDLK